MRQWRIILLIALWVMAMSLFGVRQGILERADQDSTLLKAPVVYKGQVVFNIYANLGHFSPYERSVIIGRRLEELGKAIVLAEDSLRVFQDGNEYIVTYGDQRLMVVSEADSIVLGASRQEIAQAYRQALIQRYLPGFVSFNLRQNLSSMVKTVLLVLLILGITVFLFWLLSRLFGLLDRLKKVYPLGLVIRGVRLLKADQFDRFIKIAGGILRFVISVLILYFALYWLLYVIPSTRHIAMQLQAYLARPLADVWRAVLRYMPNLFFIAVVVIISRYLLRFLKYFFDEIGKGHIRFKNFYAGWAYSTYQIVRFLILFFVVVIIFPYLPGSGSPAFQGISIFVGVLFSLGSSSAVSNIIAGIILTYMRAFKEGDFVQIGDKQGNLIEASLLTVRIRTVKNEDISIPNSIALAGNIKDYSVLAKEGKLILHTKVALGYEVPWEKVEALLIEAALKSEGINKNKQPFVHITALKDYYVEYELNAYTDDPDSMGGIYSQLHRNVLDVFHAAGIEMVLPMYNAIRDGNASTVPQLMTSVNNENDKKH